MNSKVELYATSFLAISGITLFSPFYSWGAYGLFIIAAAYIIGIICVSFLLFRQRTFKIEIMIVGMFLFLLFAWQLFPFRSNITFGYGGKVIGIFLILLFLFLKNTNKQSFIDQTQRIFAVLGLLSFIIVVLLAVGIELPYYVMKQNFRDNPNELFYIYPGTVMLSTQGFFIPSGGVLFRSSGIFAEPGHFGVVCGLLLAANGFSFKTIRSKMILLGGISSFSGSFFLIMVSGLLIKLIIKKSILSKYTVGIFLFVMISSLLFIMSPQDFQNRFLWNRLERINDIEDLYASRAKGEFNHFFEKYSTSAQSLVGVGQLPNIRASDWRYDVAKYGWLVTIFYFMFYFSLFLSSRASKEIKTQMIIAILITAYHRVSYIDLFPFVAIIASALAVDVRLNDFKPKLGTRSNGCHSWSTPLGNSNCDSGRQTI